MKKLVAKLFLLNAITCKQAVYYEIYTYIYLYFIYLSTIKYSKNIIISYQNTIQYFKFFSTNTMYC